MKRINRVSALFGILFTLVVGLTDARPDDPCPSCGSLPPSPISGVIEISGEPNTPVCDYLVGSFNVELMNDVMTVHPLSGAVNIINHKEPCGGWAVCQGMEAVWSSLEIPTSNETYTGRVYKITMALQYASSGCAAIFDEFGNPESCEPTHGSHDMGPITMYTPADQPHPILNYILNEKPETGCLRPGIHKDGDPPDTKDDPQLGEDPYNDEDHKKGDPISIYNGNNVHSQLDVSLPTPFAGGLQVKRYYNSRSNEDDLEKFQESVKSIGYGWTHNYNVALTYLNFWLHQSSAPLQGCDPNFFFGYITYRWWQVLDESGRIVYFYQHPCSNDFVGIHGEKTHITSTSPPVFFGGEYRWQRQDGSTYVFSSYVLQEIIDPYGNRQVMSHTADGLLETVTDEATGKVLTFHYNADNLLDHISGPATDSVPDGIWVSYGYDASGNLTTVTYPDGSGYVYEYSDPYDPHNLTAKKDQDGNVIFGWAYDAQDRGISSTTNDDNGVTIDYVSDNTVEVTSAYGVTHTHTLTTIDGKRHITSISGPADCPGCGEDTVRYEYNSDGRIEEVEYVDGRIDRREVYDNRGNLLTEILDAGGPDQVTIHWTYHPTMNKPLSRIQASVLGSGDKVTIWDYDDDGDTTPNESPTAKLHRLIERGFTLDTAGSAVPYEYITTFEYNSKGQVTAIDGPSTGSADTTAYAYNASTGNLLSITQPSVGTTSFTQYDNAGNPTHIIDPNGVETVLTYDGRNRVLTSTRNGATTSTTYTPRGKPDVVTDAAGRALDFQYNSQSHLERIVDPNGNYQYFGYNALGRINEESTHEPGGAQTRILRYDYGDPLNNAELAAGKPWKIIRRNHDDTGDLETRYTYDGMGNITSVTDAAGRTTSYQYDAFNRLTCIEQPGMVVTDYEYDRQGNLISITDPEGLLTQYLYDDMGRLVKIESPDTGITYLTYDESGNRIRQDQNGIVIQYSYDDLNRLVQTTYTDGTPGVTQVYDTGAGNYLKGRLAAVYDASGQRHFSYDANGYLDTENRVISGISYATDYNFDAAGNLLSIVYPTGQVIDYIANSTDPGRISQVRMDSSQLLANTLAYKPFGPLSSMTLGNAIQVSQAFDKNYQITAISAGSLLDRTYTPDNAGSITAITDNLDGNRSQSFGYDDLSRLTSASGIYGAINFSYDNNGNRQTHTSSQGTDTYSYVSGTNHIDAISGSRTVNFDHDSRGNLIARTYNSAGGPSADNQADYTYTHDGQRIQKSLQAGTTVYHYDITGRLIAETDAVGNMVKAYVWLNSQPLAQILADGSVYYYHNDHLGTPQKMTDASGTLVWAADYLPFGQADVTIAAVENNLRFAGQYYDSETGLHYNYWRFYDPKLGRYLRADPIGLAGGINPYAYVDSNPLSNIDPYGLDTTIWVTRLNSNSISLTGQISAVSSNTGASLSGYTLEHGTGSAFPHINEGTYSAIIQTHSYATGKKYSIPMIRVLGSNVAGGQIHNGSNLGDSAGCTLAANNEGKNQNTISGSRNFMRDLNNLIQNDGGKITVIYTDLSGLVR